MSDPEASPVVAVFAGPTLHCSLRRPGIEYRPPAGRGDLEALLHQIDGPLIVGILDCATQVPALPPKEILGALLHGTRIFGAAGDGALRAVECAGYGMTGVGRIYDDCAARLISRADEYLMPSAPGRADQPLAGWRLALADAVLAGQLDRASAEAFTRAAGRVSWSQRTLAEVVRASNSEMSAPQISRASEILLRADSNVMRHDVDLLMSRLLREAAS